VACLDTTFLIDLSRRHSGRRARARNKLRNLAAKGERLSTTRFSVAEMYVGVFRARDREREREAVSTVLAGLDILEFDAASARAFGNLTARLQELGRPAGDMDVLIAATALSAGETKLVTRNPTHYGDIPGVAVEGY